MASITEPGRHSRSKQSRSPATAPLWPGVGAIILHLVLISVGAVGYGVARGSPDEPSAGLFYAISGASLLVSIGALWWYLSPSQRQVAFPLHWPSRSELGWTLLFVPVGLLAFLVGEQVGIALGGEPIDLTYDITAPATVAGVFFGAVLVAPLVEEFIYRGILISALDDRGWSVLAVGAASVTIFAVAHGLPLGIAGVGAIAGMAVFPTVLRLRFDNLAGAWLHHFLNNIVAYLLYPVLIV